MLSRASAPLKPESRLPFSEIMRNEKIQTEIIVSHTFYRKRSHFIDNLFSAQAGKNNTSTN
jgi:hypothetical protein